MISAGNNPSSKGDSEGPLFREGAFFEMYNSIVTSNATGYASNECIEVADSEGPETIDAVEDGTSVMASNVIACAATDFVKSSPNLFANSAVEDAELLALLTSGSNTNNVLDNVNIEFTSLITGGTNTRGYLTADTITDSTSAVVFDQSSDLFDVSSADSYFETPTYLGAASSSDDWLAGWTVGLAEPLDP